MDLKLDDGLKTLIESGKEKGYLTYSQVNDYLPDDAVNPEKLDQLLMLLEEQGIELIDESEAEEREAGTGRRRRRGRDADAELDLTFVDEERRPPHRRPGAHVPDADGRDPAAQARTRKSPWPRRSKSPASASAARCSNATTPCANVVETLKRVHCGDLPFDRTDQGVADREPRKGQDPPAHAAQPARRSNT